MGIWERPEILPVLREEVEEAVCSMKAGKSPGVDNIPSELLKNGGEATTTEALGNEGMAERVDTRHTFTKERQPQTMSEL